ncbi:hypothetical protein L218DRAFT_1081876 [Marasmius fiardii PR-910]|nr:hypothetical protein L218DRAFT_1081876 [Marasmius fiardii PR-910]
MSQTPTIPHPGVAADPVTASPASGHGKIPLNAKRSSVIKAGDKDVEKNDKSKDDDGKESPRSNLLLEDVRKGIIKTTDGKKELTILLVGQTGVGKTALLSFIGNVLEGRKVDQYIDMHETSFEMGGSQSHSQTDAATLYEFKSQNGVVVRILDTPGLADTRGVAVDDRHKTSIAEAIQEHVAVVNAVFIIANGTQPRFDVATDYVLTTLTAIFPRTLVQNIGFIYTNVSNPLSCNFVKDSLPSELQDAEDFLLDNPLAMWRKYKDIEGELSSQMRQKHFLTVQDAERKALDVLASLVDWIDQCSPQPTRDIISLYEQSQAIEKNIVDALAQLQYAAGKKRELEELKKQLEKANSDVDMFKNFETIMSRKRYIQKPQDDRFTVVCVVPGCYSNCREHPSNPDNRWRKLALTLSFDGTNEAAAVCSACNHKLINHQTSPWQWHQVEEDVRVVNNNRRVMYERAKKEKGKQEASKELAEVEIDKSAKEIETAINGVARAATAYSKLALAGSFVTQIVKSIRVMDYTIEVMTQKNDSDPAEVQKLKESVESMKKKLKFLEEATRQKQEKSNFISRVGGKFTAVVDKFLKTPKVNEDSK